MRLRTIFLFDVLVSLLAIGPGSGHAQSQPPAATQQPDAASAQPSPPSAQAAPLANAKPTKVWTNDEIGTLRNDHNISAGGTRAPQNVSATSKTNTKAISTDENPAWYRGQLATLQGEIDKLDPQIARLKAFLSGENVSDPPTMHHQPGTPQEELKQMETKRQAAAAKMDDLLERARHNGIEPGALR
jgi:hypothetical protein